MPNRDCTFIINYYTIIIMNNYYDDCIKNLIDSMQLTKNHKKIVTIANSKHIKLLNYNKIMIKNTLHK